MKEYKVLSQNDDYFSNDFAPEKLEEAMNEYAQKGWEVISATSVSIPGALGGTKDEFIVVMEREK